MCGVAGFDFSPQSRIPLTRRAILLAVLAQAMESRGSQSWGAHAPQSNRTAKDIGPVTEGLDVTAWHGERTLMIHTRYATTGKVTAANAHPFTLASGLVGQHNGMVYNHAELCKAHGDEPVDSIHLLRAIDEGRELSTIDAYGSVQYVLPGDPAIRLGRFNGGELSVWRIDGGGSIFASTEEACARALGLAGLSSKARPVKVDEGALLVLRGGVPYILDEHGLDVGGATKRWFSRAIGDIRSAGGGGISFSAGLGNRQSHGTRDQCPECGGTSGRHSRWCMLDSGDDACYECGEKDDAHDPDCRIGAWDAKWDARSANGRT